MKIPVFEASEILVEISSDAPESLSYVLLEDFIPVFKSWSWLVHLKLDAWPYSFSRMGFVIKEDWAALLTLALIPPMEISSFVMLQLRCVNPLALSRYLANKRPTSYVLPTWTFHLLVCTYTSCLTLKITFKVNTSFWTLCRFAQFIYEKRRKMLRATEGECDWTAHPCRFLCHSTLINF